MKKNKFDPIMPATDDHLYIPEVREWSLQKYKLVGSYCDIFTTGMKDKWNQLVYIDLFAGAGYARIKESGKIYKNSALIAMSLKTPFTKYILCEQDPQRFEALEKRVNRDYKHLNIELIYGDSNKNVSKVQAAIPKFNKGNTLLPFCFVDPFSLNLKFTTIATLSNNLMDFLILKALHMDANRNFDKYYQEENVRIAEYLDLPDWRDHYEARGKKEFVKFLADTYQEKMIKFGYQTSKHMHQIRSNEKNLPLYYLAFYSKHPTGEQFFKEVQKRVTNQHTLDF